MEIRWGTHDGRRVPISQLEDKHIVNIIYWMKTSKMYTPRTREAFRQEAIKRKFMDEFIELGPYPYQNDKGEWVNPKTLEAEQ